MQGDDRPNPFTSSRVTSFSTDSLLTYGDEQYSLFKRLTSNSRLYRSQATINGTSIEQRILWKYEKEFYGTDESGHSLAEQAFDLKIQSKNKQKQDFWSKIVPQTKKLSIKNPFSQLQTISSLDTASNLTQPSRLSLHSSPVTAITTNRQANRQQISKIRKTINLQKNSEVEVSDSSKFSVLKMYKNKKNDEIMRATTFSFALTPQKQILTPQKEAFTPQKEEPAVEAKLQPPQSIFVGEEQYFYIPLV